MAYGTSYISQVTLPDGITYDIKDAWSRERLSGLSGAMHFIGVSTTDPTSESGPTVSGVSSFVAGDVVVYTPAGKQECEYVYNGTSWQEFGSTGSLKALAFKDNASGSIDGSAFKAAAQTFKGTLATLAHSVTSARVEASGTYKKANDINTTLSATATASGGNVELSTYANFAVVDSDGSVTPGSAPSLAYTNVSLKAIDSVVAGTPASLGSGFYTAGTKGTLPTLTQVQVTASRVSVTAGSEASLEYNPVKTTYVSAFDGGSVASLTYANTKASHITSFNGGSAATLEHSDARASYVNGFSTGTLPSFTQGAKAAWSASVEGEVLTFSWTPNGNDTFGTGSLPSFDVTSVDVSKINSFSSGSVATMTYSDIDASYVSAFDGGSVASLTRSDVEVSKITNWTTNKPTEVTANDVVASNISYWDAGAVTIPASIELSAFNGGTPTSVVTADKTLSAISYWNAGSATEVTLPTFSTHSAATGVSYITQPTITVGDIELTYAMTFTDDTVSVAGNVDVVIADHSFTPEGTNAESAVSGTVRVTVE